MYRPARGLARGSRRAERARGSGMGGIVTVFGGSGFIGRYLVQRLARDGWTTRVAVRHPARAGFLNPTGNIGQLHPPFVLLRGPAALTASLTCESPPVNKVSALLLSVPPP